MNREIKFRGKNSRSEWIIGDLLRNRGETFIAPDGVQNPLATAEDFKVDPETVGQFTGLLDKNGREIYEGDIVTTVQPSGGFFPPAPPATGEVKVCPLRGVCVEKANGLFVNLYEHINEVIGNIYDNPELLKS